MSDVIVMWVSERDWDEWCVTVLWQCQRRGAQCCQIYAHTLQLLRVTLLFKVNSQYYCHNPACKNFV